MLNAGRYRAVVKNVCEHEHLGLGIHNIPNIDIWGDYMESTVSEHSIKWIYLIPYTPFANKWIDNDHLVLLG